MSHSMHNLFRPFIAFIAAGVFLAASPARADDEAEAFIEGVLVEAEPILKAETQAEMFDGIAALVDKYVDMRRVGLFALGQYARKITPEQKEIYLPLFKKYATQIYQNSLSEYSGQKLSVTGSVDRSERDIIVNSKVVGASPGDSLADLVVHWRVYRDRDGALTIIDAGANEVWLAIEQRSQFTSIISNNGGGEAGIDALIAELQEQTGG
jgi:phospholipid transport system substrate-binding protein